jgi:hypothetical protein
MAQPLRLPGFSMTIRANATLSKLVHFWRDPEKTQPFDFTGYSVFYSSVKADLLDAAAIFSITVLVSDVGLDALGNEIPVTPADGWLQFYAPPEETTKAQALAEAEYGIRVWVDLMGVDSEANRIPLGQNDSTSLVASATEVFA